MVACHAPAQRVPAVLLVAAVVAACGKSSSTSLSHAALVSRAEAICAHANAQVTALERSTSTGARRSTQGFSITNTELDELRRLRPPSGDRASFEEYLRNGDRLIADLRRSLTVGVAHPQQTIRTLAPLVTRSRALAAQLGLRACALPPEGPGSEGPPPSHAPPSTAEVESSVRDSSTAKAKRKREAAVTAATCHQRKAKTWACRVRHADRRVAVAQATWYRSQVTLGISGG
jgi:hypothetical protein